MSSDRIFSWALAGFSAELKQDLQLSSGRIFSWTLIRSSAPKGFSAELLQDFGQSSGRIFSGVVTVLELSSNRLWRWALTVSCVELWQDLAVTSDSNLEFYFDKISNWDLIGSWDVLWQDLELSPVRALSWALARSLQIRSDYSRALPVFTYSWIILESLALLSQDFLTDHGQICCWQGL